MTTKHEQIIAYLATLAALLAVYLGTLLILARHPELVGKVETFGLGTLTGGLIGVLRIPTRSNVTVDNPPSDPVPVAPETMPRPMDLDPFIEQEAKP